MRPAIIALVVAIAGMMLPAIAETHKKFCKNISVILTKNCDLDI